MPRAVTLVALLALPALQALAPAGASGPAATEAALQARGPFWALVAFTADAPGDVVLQATWTFRAPSGDPNLTRGGYDAYQDHLRVEGRGVASFFDVTRSACLANLTLGPGLAGLRAPGASAEPPACQLSTGGFTGTTTWHVPVAGHHTLVVARAGDFVRGAELRFQMPGGYAVTRQGVGAGVWFLPLEAFEGTSASVSTPALEARLAKDASATVVVRHGLTGVFAMRTLGAELAADLEVDGPEGTLTGASEYFFTGGPAGRWRFKAVDVASAGVATFLHAFVLDAPL